MKLWFIILILMSFSNKKHHTKGLTFYGKLFEKKLGWIEFFGDKKHVTAKEMNFGFNLISKINLNDKNYPNHIKKIIHSFGWGGTLHIPLTHMTKHTSGTTFFFKKKGWGRCNGWWDKRCGNQVLFNKIKIQITHQLNY